MEVDPPHVSAHSQLVPQKLFFFIKWIFSPNKGIILTNELPFSAAINNIKNQSKLTFNNPQPEGGAALNRPQWLCCECDPPPVSLKYF